MASFVTTARTSLLCGLLFVIAAPARAADASKLLPGDSEIVASINVQQILQSALFKKYGLDQAKAALARSPESQKAFKALNFDPLQDVHSVTLATTGDPSAGKVLVIVNGRYDVDKINQAAANFVEKNPKFKIHKEGSLQILEGESQDRPMFAAVLNAQTVVLSPAKDHLVASVQRPNAGGINPVLQGAIKGVDGGQSLWLAALVTDKMKEDLGRNPQTQQLAPKLQAVTGTVHITDAALANVSIHTADAQSANQVKMFFTQIVPLLKVLAQGNEQAGPILNELLNNLKISSDKSSVSISLKVTEDMLLKALNQAGQ